MGIRYRGKAFKCWIRTAGGGACATIKMLNLTDQTEHPFFGISNPVSGILVIDEWVGSMASRTQCLLFLLCASLLVVAVGRSADSPKVSVDPRAKPALVTPKGPRTDIRIDTTVVLINVTVTDPLNRFVTGLEKENFRLLEDKIEQKVIHFASEDAPLSIGLVFDTSGSMGNKLNKSRQAVSEFFKTANPEDEFFLVQF